MTPIATTAMAATTDTIPTPIATSTNQILFSILPGSSFMSFHLDPDDDCDCDCDHNRNRDPDHDFNRDPDHDDVDQLNLVFRVAWFICFPL